MFRVKILTYGRRVPGATLSTAAGGGGREKGLAQRSTKARACADAPKKRRAPQKSPKLTFDHISRGSLLKAGEHSSPLRFEPLNITTPHQGYENITDEYMLGEDILVCPALTKETFEKDITFPQGLWKDENGKVYKGRQVLRMPAPIDKLLWFRRVKE